MRLRNINPLGEVEVPLLGRVIGAGEEFECTPEQGDALLEQVGNYEPAESTDTPNADDKPKRSAR